MEVLWNTEIQREGRRVGGVENKEKYSPPSSGGFANVQDYS